jgi:DNA-binding winged helix-turn-helix (wHTH) protein
MSSESHRQEYSVFHFGPFRLDVRNEQLWRGEHALKLTPTAFVLLRYLVERAGRLVTKEELLQAVWPERR